MGEGLFWLIVVAAPLLVIIGVALFHVVARRPDLKVMGKAGWIVVIVVIPYVGVLIYALNRPPGVAPGKENEVHDETAPTMRRLRELIEGHDSGAIDDDQFAAAKAELFGLH